MHLKNSYQKFTRAKIKRLNFDFEVLVCVRMCFFLGMRRTLIEHFSWEESAEQGVRGGVQECASPYLPDHENLRFSNMTSILRHSSAVHPPPPREKSLLVYLSNCALTISQLITS